MVSAVDTNDVARRAEIIYADRLRSDLERDHRNEFVAIEPDSGDYYHRVRDLNNACHWNCSHKHSLSHRQSVLLKEFTAC